MLVGALVQKFQGFSEFCLWVEILLKRLNLFTEYLPNQEAYYESIRNQLSGVKKAVQSYTSFQYVSTDLGVNSDKHHHFTGQLIRPTTTRTTTYGFTKNAKCVTQIVCSQR